MAKITKLVSMAYDDEESYSAEMPIAMDSKPEYPYGLQICLTDKELKKLGLDATEAGEGLGGEVRGVFVAKITSANINMQEGGETHSRVELQITELALDSDDVEDAEPVVAKAKALIYDAS